MRRPPFPAVVLLWLVLPEGDSESITGDLEEEFELIARNAGMHQARRWFRSQVLRSVPAMLRMRWRSGELPAALLIALALTALPLLGIDRLWEFVLSQIPLKADATQPSNIFVAKLGCAAIFGLAAGYVAVGLGGRRTAAVVALLSGAASGCVGLAGSLPAPVWYAVTQIAVVMGATAAPASIRRRQTR